MPELICYKTLPEWDAESLPNGFRNQHNTKTGTWARLRIKSGRLRFYSLDEAGEVLDTALFDKDSDIPFIEPQAWHRVEPADKDLRMQLSFYCELIDYYHKKYGLSRPHSDVVDALNHISQGTALDVGCGSGRNVLFLRQQGFDVSGFDRDTESINKLQRIIAHEKLDKIEATVHDANAADISNAFDLITCTVVMMFLDAERIPHIIENMQARTVDGGYNVIVCATDSDDYPLAGHTLPFDFGFKPGELAQYYDGWHIKKYNEDLGHLHRTDAAGNPIALRFSTLIAQKP
ncbi:MAG: SAM-dependent methyltransferase TehB [Pseudomonadota bacterium]